MEVVEQIGVGAADGRRDVVGHMAIGLTDEERAAAWLREMDISLPPGGVLKRRFEADAGLLAISREADGLIGYVELVSGKRCQSEPEVLEAELAEVVERVLERRRPAQEQDDVPCAADSDSEPGSPTHD